MFKGRINFQKNIIYRISPVISYYFMYGETIRHGFKKFFILFIFFSEFFLGNFFFGNISSAQYCTCKEAVLIMDIPTGCLKPAVCSVFVSHPEFSGTIPGGTNLNYIFNVFFFAGLMKDVRRPGSYKIFRFVSQNFFIRRGYILEKTL